MRKSTSFSPAQVLSPARNSIVGLTSHAVAHPEGRGRRAGDVLLDVLQVDVDRGMPAGAVPVLEHVGMAVDDHRDRGIGALRLAPRRRGPVLADWMPASRRRASRGAELLHVELEQTLDLAIDDQEGAVEIEEAASTPWSP